MTDFEPLKRNLPGKGVTTCIASYVDMHGVSKSKLVLNHVSDWERDRYLRFSDGSH
ncbi:MAG: hypothetical protein OEN23_09670 [Paracoccaceae bacterium]|nr:hypothetical protein [Paracoccaceae bacterium]